MSSYYQYNFVSAEPLIALLNEELKSFLDTGSVDNAVWPIYLDHALKDLGKGMLEIVPFIVNIRDYEGRLPDNFVSIREAWMCTNSTESYRLPGAQYQEVEMLSTTTLLGRYPETTCQTCDECPSPDVIKAVYKTTNEAFAYYTKQYLLKPGNIHARESCAKDCINLGASSVDTFDVHGNKFVTNFKDGTAYLLYYAKTLDESGYQMIPDNRNIQKYLEAYIKFKVYEQLSNQVTDETYNQANQKAADYRQRMQEAYIIAFTESKKETIYDKQKAISRTKRRFNQYRIS